MFWFELSAGDAFDIVVITNLSSEGTVRENGAVTTVPRGFATAWR